MLAVMKERATASTVTVGLIMSSETPLTTLRLVQASGILNLYY